MAWSSRNSRSASPGRGNFRGSSGRGGYSGYQSRERGSYGGAGGGGGDVLGMFLGCVFLVS